MNWASLSPQERDALVAVCVLPTACIDVPDDGPYPPYSTDMNAAWEVLLHMVETYYANGEIGETQPIQSRHIWERFCDAMRIGAPTHGNYYRWIASWTPETLCIAALRAVGVEIEL